MNLDDSGSILNRQKTNIFFKSNGSIFAKNCRIIKNKKYFISLKYLNSFVSRSMFSITLRTCLTKRNVKHYDSGSQTFPVRRPLKIFQCWAKHKKLICTGIGGPEELIARTTNGPLSILQESLHQDMTSINQLWAHVEVFDQSSDSQPGCRRTQGWRQEVSGVPPNIKSWSILLMFYL